EGARSAHLDGIRRRLPMHGSRRRTIEKALGRYLGAPGGGPVGVTAGAGVAIFDSESLSSMRSWSSRRVVWADRSACVGRVASAGAGRVLPALVSVAEARSAASRRMESRRALS